MFQQTYTPKIIKITVKIFLALSGFSLAPSFASEAYRVENGVITAGKGCGRADCGWYPATPQKLAKTCVFAPNSGYDPRGQKNGTATMRTRKTTRVSGNPTLT